MVGNLLLDKDGLPIDGGGQKLTPSAYNPPDEVKKLFERCQMDYMSAWRLQHRPFREFDGYSLLQRTMMDQETFAAYVGAEYVPQHKKWRWKGRKNTARNKIMGIAAHLIAGMLFPYVHASNEENEEDKMTAKVMKILVEDHLKKAGYELKFLFMIISALVNPAVFVEVAYLTAFQRIKQRLKDGSYKVTEAVDDLLSGLNLYIYPIDQILLGDFYTFDIQRQPFVVKVRRIAWEEARKIYAGKYKDENGEDLFNYVQAGKTRVVLAGQEYQTLYDIEWTEADRNYVQEMTFYYRADDMELTWVGGVGMFNYKDCWNSNPFTHRRMSLIGDKWASIPIVPIAKSGFEVLDPTMRFPYYTSAARKEYWDALAQDRMHQLAYDGTYLDVIKPTFLSGVAKMDSTVMIPGATIGMPAGASMTPYSGSPNLIAAMNMTTKEESDMAESTQDKIMSGVTEKGVTAYATAKAEQNARIFLGNAGLMVADLVKQIGELTVDCIIQHTTVGEVDATVPEALRMKYKNILIKTKESGRDLTNRIRMTDKDMGKEKSADDIRAREWELYDEAGGAETDQRIYEVNPYKFARNKFAITVDAEQIISRSMGTDQLRKDRAFAILTNPLIYPFIDQQGFANMQIEEYSDGDPDKLKSKGNTQQPGMPIGQGGQPDMLNQILGQGGMVGQPQAIQQ